MVQGWVTQSRMNAFDHSGLGTILFKKSSDVSLLLELNVQWSAFQFSMQPMFTIYVDVINIINIS